MQTFWNELTHSWLKKLSGQNRLNKEMSSPDTPAKGRVEGEGLVDALVGSQSYLVGFLLNLSIESSKLLSAFFAQMLSDIPA